MQPFRRPILEQRRNDINRIESVSAQDTWVTGRVRVDAPGEVLIDLRFPVMFGERPLPILGGGEATDGSGAPRTMYFPRISATVVNWDQEGHYYRGARLAVVAEGHPEQSFWVTYAFVGVALTSAAIPPDEGVEE